MFDSIMDYIKPLETAIQDNGQQSLGALSQGAGNYSDKQKQNSLNQEYRLYRFEGQHNQPIETNLSNIRPGAGGQSRPAQAENPEVINNQWLARMDQFRRSEDIAGSTMAKGAK